MSLQIATMSTENVTLTIPKSRMDQFRNPKDGRRWGQAVYDFLELQKITDEHNKAWCDRLYAAGDLVAKKMVEQVLDHNN